MGITNIETHFSEMNFVILLQLNVFVFALPFWESAGNSLSNFGRQISDGLDDVWDNSFGGSDANLESDHSEYTSQDESNSLFLTQTPYSDEDKSSNGFQSFLEGIDETLDDMGEALKTLRERIKLTGAMRLRTNLPIVQQVQCVRHALSLVSRPKTTLTIGETILQAAGNVLLPVVLLGAYKHQIAKASHTILILNFAI